MKFRKRSILSFLLMFVFALVLAGCTDEEEKKYTVDDLDTKFTDETKLETSFENQSFFSKGIEEVTLLRLIDGDTTHFLDKDRQTIKIRYLGVNTPESTGKIAPWGKQASYFVKNKLEDAYSIVIETDEVGKTPETDSTGDRYLGYVWYKTTKESQYRLLNLEIIENCFSFFSGDSENLKYGDPMREAYLEKSPMKLRVFGEKDPNYDYDITVNEISISTLRSDYSSYSTGTKLKVKVVIVRVVGNSLYLEDFEETYNEETGISAKSGIFLYHSFVPNIGKYKPGQVLEFECQASDDETYGMQLVNPSKVKSGEIVEYTIKEIDNSITSLKDYEGFVVKVNNFTVTSVTNESATGAYTIKGTMENGSELQVRVDADVSPSLKVTYPKVGSKYNVIGGVNKYVNVFEENKVYYQIKLGNLRYDGENDFIIADNN